MADPSYNSCLVFFTNLISVVAHHASTKQLLKELQLDCIYKNVEAEIFPKI